MIGVELMNRSSWNFGWCGCIGWIRWGCVLVVLDVGLMDQKLNVRTRTMNAIRVHLAYLIHAFDSLA